MPVLPVDGFLLVLADDGFVSLHTDEGFVPVLPVEAHILKSRATALLLNWLMPKIIPRIIHMVVRGVEHHVLKYLLLFINQ